MRINMHEKKEIKIEMLSARFINYSSSLAYPIYLSHSLLINVYCLDSLQFQKKKTLE